MVNVDNEEQQLNAGLSPYLSYYRRSIIACPKNRLSSPTSWPGTQAAVVLARR